MGKMRKLTTVAVENSMTREMAVQYAVWTWYQSDPGEKARDLCRAGAEIVLPRFIENEESALGTRIGRGKDLCLRPTNRTQERKSRTNQ